MPDAERADWLAAIDAATDDCEITLGMLREDHACLDENGRTAADLGGECDCETVTFSWTACDVCGGNLGGERHAVTFWHAHDLPR
jgi:hypothetical protein